jgi:hypothetical protein
VHLGNIRPERHRTFEQFDGVRPAELMRDDAEAVETAGMIRIGGAHLAIQALGLGQPPGLVMIERYGELPGDLLPLVRSHGPLPPTLVNANATAAAGGSLVPIDIDIILPGIEKVIAATGCQTYITATATGGGRP